MLAMGGDPYTADLKKLQCTDVASGTSYAIRRLVEEAPPGMISPTATRRSNPLTARFRDVGIELTKPVTARLREQRPSARTGLLDKYDKLQETGGGRADFLGPAPGPGSIPNAVGIPGGFFDEQEGVARRVLPPLSPKAGDQGATSNPLTAKAVAVAVAAAEELPALPSGWTAHIDQAGRAYYSNASLSATQRERPTAETEVARLQAKHEVAGAEAAASAPPTVRAPPREDAGAAKWNASEATASAVATTAGAEEATKIAATADVETNADAGRAVAEVEAKTAAASATTATEEAALPAGWVKMEQADGKVYYYSRKLNSTQWDRPSSAACPLPQGWVQKKDEKGRAYYHNEKLGTNQWERPKAQQ